MIYVVTAHADGVMVYYFPNMHAVHWGSASQMLVPA